MLSLERLRTLHAIATYGSVRAAADALHVTTSAISQQMAKLETELGQRLLDRNGRGVRLTDAATRLVKHADKIMSVVAEAEADLEAHRGAVVGRLTLATFPSAARGLAPDALAMLRARHPAVQVSLSELEPEDGVAMVTRGDLDLLIVQDWFDAPLAVSDGLVKSPLLDDIVDVALPAAHPLAGRAVIELHEVAREPWISWSRRSICHDWLLVTLRAQGVEPTIAHHAGELQTQLALVAAGFGVSVAPRLGRGRLPDGVSCVAVRPALSRRVYAIWRADAARRPAIRAAVEALRAAAAVSAPPALLARRNAARTGARAGRGTPVARGRGS
jgi:DNA-binding transcriptional LysR family regulator